MDESRAVEARSVGGKFANLSKLQSAGVRVPPGFAVSTSAFRLFVGKLRGSIEPSLKGLDFQDVESTETASRKISDVIMRSKVPREVETGVRQAYRKLGRRIRPEGGSVPVAVRSSATAEDLAGASLAGQHETYLWVKGEDQILRYMKECWASLFSARSLKYRHINRIDSFEVDMGVVVQQMVNSSKSGVMFTLNPANGDPSKISIESSWGFGEAIVGGLVTPDSFIVDKVTLEMLEKRANRKLKEIVMVKDQIQEVEVPKARQGILSLNDDEVAELSNLGKSIETMYGCPQDIEWAIDDSLKFPENVFILQARPETVWAKKKREGLGKSGETLDLLIDKLIRGQKMEE
jgi:pyruvate,water dikinase